ncbi:nitrate- and nitrite sensing domain-containing protein [Streptomyces sp. NPDC005492]|uniref:sensor histidine kinase n=1 Tax=Streptomyces sp. NPDC005492 TaxID=3156883 RepID=UPI0033BC3C81
MQTGTGAGRGRSIRASLITLAVVPATAMVLLWVSGSFALFDQWHNANKEGQSAKTTYALLPALGEFQKERRLTVGLLASHGSPAALAAQRHRTDAVLAGFRAADAASGSDGSTQYRAQLATVRKRITALTAARTAVDDGKSTRQQAYAVYSDAVSSALNLFGTLSADNGDAATAADAGHALAFLRGAEALSQEEAILDGVAASRTLSVQERSALAAAQAVRTSVLSNEVQPYLPAELGAELGKAMDGSDWAALTAFEKTVADASAAHDGTIRVPAVAAARAAAPGRVSGAVQAVEGQFLGKVTADSDSRTHLVLVKALLGSALALVAVLAVALLSWRITRSLIGRMSGLRAQTLELAEERLPELITRLRTQGKRAELDDLPELDYGTDELGKVADAFNSAQRTAVSVALEQASLREGARLVFHNMSRRIQLLVHRQLTVIDSMERKEQDPQLLADLYRVDHLATRMRRNAESLTVLSGAAPRRRWKHAVPLADLLRSAVSEIEGYTRVVVEPLPSIAVLGPAVGDTIHLMAELIENGVTFSPPHTEVRVRALPVAQGYAVEVEDRGLGLSPDEYAAANELLHQPKDFSFTTLGEDPRLGLFTVGHLAHRHGITASLQASSYGGSLAVVVLPHALTEPTTDTTPPPFDTRADRHLASVTGTDTGPIPTARTGVTATGMPMRIRTAAPTGSSTPVTAASDTTQMGETGAGGVPTGYQEAGVFGDPREAGSAGDSRGAGFSAGAREAGSSADYRASGASGGTREVGPFGDSREAGPSASPHAAAPSVGSRAAGGSAGPRGAGSIGEPREAGPASGPRATRSSADFRAAGASAGSREAGSFGDSHDGGASRGPRTAGPSVGSRVGGASVGPRGSVPLSGSRGGGASGETRSGGSSGESRPGGTYGESRSGGSSGGARVGGSGRLPRRVRQAHLAPQLRERAVEADGEYGAPERRPEQARSMLAALRDGTRRARAQEEVPMPVWPTSPRDEVPASERRQLPTRPRPTRNTP